MYLFHIDNTIYVEHFQLFCSTFKIILKAPLGAFNHYTNSIIANYNLVLYQLYNLHKRYYL